MDNMSFEQKAYELEEIWGQGVLGKEDQERVEFISSLVNKDIGSILDVGCGNGLFINHILKNKSNFQSLSKMSAVDRSKAALSHIDANIDKIQASIDSLPYEDNSYDVVTCLEVIEHLPLEVYKKAISEIYRISKSTIIISVPYKDDIRNSLVECENCFTRFNANFHMTSFDENTLSKLFSGKKLKLKAIHYIGEVISYPVWITRIRNLLSPNQFPAYAICPVCGFNKNDNLQSYVANELDYKKPAFNIKSIIRYFIPKKTSPRWIVGVYEKNETV